ncbi:hypothetical protein JMJ78_0000863, partial [Colletotrichum scovillei]
SLCGRLAGKDFPCGTGLIWVFVPYIWEVDLWVVTSHFVHGSAFRCSCAQIGAERNRRARFLSPPQPVDRDTRLHLNST